MGYTREQREANEKKKQAELAANNNQNTDNVQPKSENKVENIKTENSVSTQPVKKLQIRNIPLSSQVWIYSNTYGELQYISKKTSQQIVWGSFKNRQPVSLDELITMRNTQRAFFEKNWIMFGSFVDAEYEDAFSVEELLDFLQVREYYSNILCPADIDKVFNMSADDIKAKVPNMSEGIRNAITIRANDLIETGELDSNRVIRALETALNCELRKP